MNEQLTKDFYQHIAAEKGITLTDEQLTTLLRCSTLEALPPAATENPDRDVVLHKTSDLRFDGEFTSLANLVQFRMDLGSAKDIVKSGGSLLKEVGTAAGLAALNVWLLALYAAYYVYQGMSVELSEADAKVLYAIFKIPGTSKRFTPEALHTSYAAVFSEPLDEKVWSNARDRLLELEIITRMGGETKRYRLEEEIRLKRK